jgi:hypothetical protein
MLFAKNCVACHGAQGGGDGPEAAALRIKPTDLTMPHVWAHTDGELFWWLTHGVDDPEGGLAMPGFENALSIDDRWALIDYVRAHNAGVAMRQDAAVDLPVRAPAFPLTCSGMTASTTADLRGSAVHVVAGNDVKIEIPPQSGIATINLALQDGAPPAPGTCVAADPAAWPAYAVLADVRPDKLSGAEFLVDPNGWLRAVRRPGTAGTWHTGESLIAAIRGLRASPDQPPGGVQHEHRH